LWGVKCYNNNTWKLFALWLHIQFGMSYRCNGTINSYTRKICKANGMWSERMFSCLLKSKYRRKYFDPIRTNWVFYDITQLWNVDGYSGLDMWAGLRKLRRGYWNVVREIFGKRPLGRASIRREENIALDLECKDSASAELTNLITGLRIWTLFI